jgi:hypothetical protein
MSLCADASLRAEQSEDANTLITDLDRHLLEIER